MRTIQRIKVIGGIHVTLTFNYDGSSRGGKTLLIQFVEWILLPNGLNLK